MSAMASQIADLTIVYATVYSGTDQRKQQRPASLAFAREIHGWFPRTKAQYVQKMFPFDDVIMRHDCMPPSRSTFLLGIYRLY